MNCRRGFLRARGIVGTTATCCRLLRLAKLADGSQLEAATVRLYSVHLMDPDREGAASRWTGVGTVAPTVLQRIAVRINRRGTPEPSQRYFISISSGSGEKGPDPTK